MIVSRLTHSEKLFPGSGVGVQLQTIFYHSSAKNDIVIVVQSVTVSEAR